MTTPTIEEMLRKFPRREREAFERLRRRTRQMASEGFMTPKMAEGIEADLRIVHAALASALEQLEEARKAMLAVRFYYGEDSNDAMRQLDAALSPAPEVKS